MAELAGSGLFFGGLPTPGNNPTAVSEEWTADNALATITLS